MKIRLRFLAIAVILALLLMPATALAQPQVPLLYHGSVDIDSMDAPIGTIVTAEIDGEEVATNAPGGGTREVGTYGLDVVANEGDVVVLKVNGVPGGQTTHPDPMSNWDVPLDLSVGEAPPPTLTAEAGGPYAATEGEAVSISGSASGGTAPYTYAWDFDNDGVYGDNGIITASPSVTWHVAGTYTIGLQVTDSALDTAIDTATVTVIAEGAFDPYIYDTDEDGVMSKDETLAAVADYLADPKIITKNQALEVVKLYFS